MVLGVTWVLADSSVVSAEEVCCIRGNLYSLRYSEGCTDPEYKVTPPGWPAIKVLDIKAGIGAFQNDALLDDLKQFLSSPLEYKLLHVEFSSESCRLFQDELYPRFYETQEWNFFLNVLNTHTFIGKINQLYPVNLKIHLLVI